MDSERRNNSRFSIFLLFFSTLFAQTLALTEKNLLILARNRSILGILLLSPFLICAYLDLIQKISEKISADYDNPSPKERILTVFPECPHTNCIPLSIGLTSGPSEFSDFIITELTKYQGLDSSKVQVLYNKSLQEFTDLLIKSPKPIQIGVLLCDQYAQLPINEYLKEIHCDQTKGSAYLILYNYTEVSEDLFEKNNPDPIETVPLSIKVIMDNLILNYHLKEKGLQRVEINASVQGFPEPLNRFLKGYDSASLNGPFYFFIPPMLLFGVLFSEIVKEKTTNLRNGLTVIGVFQSSYWLSWFIVCLLFSCAISNILIFSAYFYEFGTFINTPYTILFILFMLFTISMVFLGFMISTLINSLKLSYTISYSLLLGGLVLQSFFMSRSLMILFHLDDLPYWVSYIRFIFRCYPPFNFSKVLGDISAKSGSLPKNEELRWVKGKGYSWDDYFLVRKGEFEGFSYHVPSSFSSIIDLVLNILVFSILTWYFDTVIPNNKGKHEPFYFFLTKNYWGCNRKPKKNGPVEVEMRTITETQLNKQDFEEITEGLVLEGLWKTYSKDSEAAVKPLSLKIEKNELIALIGHNGAGKTTLLKILTGLLNPSGGAASIYSYDLASEMSEIHKIIGYCPQFNILWEELTAQEHLKLFAKLKGLGKNSLDSMVTTKLSEVNLKKHAKQCVNTFSGGMKRRLSVAISSIGEPKIIFLDEPTTGMDPITRREVWQLIKTLKKNRTIVLTTHSMEEADILSDRVIVMVNGEIKCNGSCLNLKNLYGQGFIIEIGGKYSKKIWKEVEKKVKSIQKIREFGNGFVFCIPKNEVSDVKKLFEIFEKNKFKDWAISNASLEEVFMKITKRFLNY